MGESNHPSHSPRHTCDYVLIQRPRRFVSRVNPKANDKHVILGVVGWKPRDFANQMNLSLSNGWGIVRTISDMVLKAGDGDAKYVLVKDPNKSILRLYDVPAGSLDEEEDEVEEPAAEEGAEE